MKVQLPLLIGLVREEDAIVHTYREEEEEWQPLSLLGRVLEGVATATGVVPQPVQRLSGLQCAVIATKKKGKKN